MSTQVQSSAPDRPAAFFGRFLKTRRVLLLLGLIGAWALLIIPTYFLIVQQMPHQDIDQRYIGSREVILHLLQGEQPPSPYAPEITLQIQERIYGRPALPEEDQQAFAYPAHIILLLFPLWLLPSLDWVESIWTALQFALLLLFPFLVASYFRWKIHWWIALLGMAAGMLGFRYSMMALVLGQFTIFAVACLLGASWAISTRRVALSALFLAELTIRPEGMFLAAFLVGFALYKREYRIAAAWVALMGFLGLLTTAMIGPWIDLFLDSLRAYSQYAQARWLPALVGPVGSGLIVVAVLLWGMALLYETRSLPMRERIMWLASVIVLAELILLPQTNPYTLAYMLLPTWTILWAGCFNPLISLTALAVLASSWWFFLQGRHLPIGLDQLLLPLALAVLLAWAWADRRRLAATCL